MRASNIVGGVFCGADIDPGTFHHLDIEELARPKNGQRPNGDQPGRCSSPPASDDSVCGHAFNAPSVVGPASSVYERPNAEALGPSFE